MTDDQLADELIGLDLPALRRYLTASVPGMDDGPLHAVLLSGGRSNLTYAVDAGSTKMVLRRPPLGHVLETAHDMAREAQVLEGLNGTSVPVPRVLAQCNDLAVIGAPFYLMERVDGVIYRGDDDLALLGEGDHLRLAHAFVDTLTDLHLLDPADLGLAALGRAEGYAERQVRRWTRQLQSSWNREVPGFEELGARLSRSIPRQQRGSLVHGDYRLDNLIVDPDDAGRILAVLDWEMATLGDPLADLGLFYLYWIGWAGIDNPIAATPGTHPGFPAWETLAERYTERTDLSLDDFDWYAALAFYKLAVILEGIHLRHVRGQTVGDGFDRIGAMVPRLVDRGLTALDGLD